jgi:hypothetical protein
MADDLFHPSSIPDSSIIVGSLPVSNNVQNAALIITHNLDVDGVGHLAVPEVLCNGVWWNHQRSILKFGNSAINTEGKARQEESVQQHILDPLAYK